MNNSSNVISDMAPKRIGLEVVVGSSIAIAIAVLFSHFGQFELLNLKLIIATSLASMASMFVAHSWGNGIAALVGEAEAPGVLYHLTYASICAVVSVIAVFAGDALIGY